jgi:hypothetical protein
MRQNWQMNSSLGLFLTVTNLPPNFRPQSVQEFDFHVLQACGISFSWAENRFNIEKTKYFQCLHGGLQGSDLGSGENISGIENLQHHCIDYNGGKPVFVRGTYLMVLLLLLFNQVCEYTN